MARAAYWLAVAVNEPIAECIGKALVKRYTDQVKEG
jgi:hypothetical protein